MANSTSGRGDFRQPGDRRSSSTGAETFLELHRGRGRVRPGQRAAVVPSYDGRRIALTGLLDRNEVVVDPAALRHRRRRTTFTDPADGERYVSAYVGVDITQRVFACDQVDLKALITLTVVAHSAWTGCPTPKSA